jgi:L,D-transpeptidase ErfK/SrfK
MFPEDIDQLYHMVDVGTQVYIVKQPIKVGWLNNVLYVESHPDLEGEETTLEERTATAGALIQKMNNVQFSDIDQSALHDALEKQTGNPVAIYEHVLTEEEIQAQAIAPPVPKAQPVSSSLVKAAVPVAAKKVAEFKKIVPTKSADKSKTPSVKKVVDVKKVIETKTSKAVPYIPTHKPSPTGYFRGF